MHKIYLWFILFPLYIFSPFARCQVNNVVFKWIYTDKPVKQQQLYKQVVNFLKQLQPTDKHKPEVKLLTKDFALHYPLNILIDEDYPLNQLFAQKVLAKPGYQSDLAENGLEVLEVVNHKVYDVILMDVLMPGMDGLEATRVIRASKENQPYIIATIANAMQEDKKFV